MKNIVRKAAMVLLPLYLAVFAVFCLPSKKAAENNGQKAAVISELWHIDIFEGGSGSRGEFLKQQAIAFEKNSKQRFVLVRNMTYEQMLNGLAEGRKPDMISYGAGIACDILADLRAFEGSIRGYENIILSGAADGVMFGVPWCCGGYVIAAVKEYITGENADYALMLADHGRKKSKGTLYSFTAGLSRFNNPYIAAFVANNNIRLGDNSFDSTKTYSQYEAYSKFVSKNASVFLLGTQRDAVRLSGRENSSDFDIQAVKGFSDLVCYISISKHTASYGLCRDFIEYLLKEEIQRKLTSINMFSVNTEGLYTEGIMKEIECAVPDYNVFNAFISKEILIENRVTALKALNGEEDAVKKIREMLPNDLN